MKAVIIGRNGQVAWELSKTCPPHVETIFVGRDKINLASPESVESVIESDIDVVINASAYTNVDKAEEEPSAADMVNHIGVFNLAKACKLVDAKFIHISTDFVFDGKGNSPYELSSEANPINEYGLSKYKGELAIKDTYPNKSTIIRTSWVYSVHGNNFVKTMLRLMKEKESLSIVSDQIGSPTYAKDLAVFIWSLIDQDQIDEMYHWCNEGEISWYDFAMEIQKQGLEQGLLSQSIPISPISSDQYPQLATRPKYSVLSLSRLPSEFVPLPWRESLSTMLSELVAQNSILDSKGKLNAK